MLTGENISKDDVIGTDFFSRPRMYICACMSRHTTISVHHCDLTQAFKFIIIDEC